MAAALLRCHSGGHGSSRACTLVSLVVGTMLILILASVTAVEATQFTVGGDQGWTLGSNYTQWAATNVYAIGDTLLFNYPAKAHSVLQVNGPNYKACNTSTSARLFYDNNGGTIFTLNATGKYWFICGVGTHCSDGNMKFSINVASTVATPDSNDPSSSSSSSSAAFLILLGALMLLFFFF